jgi:hypothetical protein
MSPNEVAESFELFDRVVEATGLSTIIARAAVARACMRAGVPPSDLTRDSLLQVLPHLEQTLEVYFGQGAFQRARSIRMLSQRPSWRPKP